MYKYTKLLVFAIFGISTIVINSHCHSTDMLQHYISNKNKYNRVDNTNIVISNKYGRLLVLANDDFLTNDKCIPYALCLNFRELITKKIKDKFKKVQYQMLYA